MFSSVRARSAPCGTVRAETDRSRVRSRARGASTSRSRTLQRELAAQFQAELLARDALRRQPTQHLFHADLVAPRDGLRSLVNASSSTVMPPSLANCCCAFSRMSAP